MYDLACLHQTYRHTFHDSMRKPQDSLVAVCRDFSPYASVAARLLTYYDNPVVEFETLSSMTNSFIVGEQHQQSTTCGRCGVAKTGSTRTAGVSTLSRLRFRAEALRPQWPNMDHTVQHLLLFALHGPVYLLLSGMLYAVVVTHAPLPACPRSWRRLTDEWYRENQRQTSRRLRWVLVVGLIRPPVQANNGRPSR